MATLFRGYEIIFKGRDPRAGRRISARPRVVAHRKLFCRVRGPAHTFVQQQRWPVDSVPTQPCSATAFATLGTTGDRAVPYTTTLRENAWPIATKHFAQNLKGQARMRSTCPAIASGPTSGRARKDVERRAILARRLTPSACRSTPHSPGAPEPARECSQVLGRCRDPGALGARRAQ